MSNENLLFKAKDYVNDEILLKSTFLIKDFHNPFPPLLEGGGKVGLLLYKS